MVRGIEHVGRYRLRMQMTGYGYTLEPAVPAPRSFEEPQSLVASIPEPESEASFALKLSRADQMLGRLDGMLAVLPERQVMTDCIVRMEALASARMEGKLSSFAELVHIENHPDACDHHTVAAYNHVKALRHGLHLMGAGQPLNASNLRDLYEIVHYGQLDEESQSAQVRRASFAGSGIVAYVPSAIVEKNEAFTRLDTFLRTGTRHDMAVLQAARQFADLSGVHSLLEEDGRMQRMMIPLVLTQNGTIRSPLLPLSPFLCKYRDESRRLLKAARSEGDWDPWIAFFVEAITRSCQATVALVCRLLSRFQQDEQALNASGMNKGVSHIVLRLLRETPYISPLRLAFLAGHGLNSILAVLDNLKDLGIIVEQAPRPGRMVCYLPYLQILEEGAAG
jgi:Fic family protein